MSKKRGTSFADAMGKADSPTAPKDETKPNILEDRLSRINEAQQTVTLKTLLVDPSECALWKHHNRFYDRLNMKTCADLIDTFIAQGKQEEPAYVRRLPKDAPHKYEIIAGARRFWTVNYLRSHNYPDFQFLIQVRDVDDEEAFRLADVENYARKDISAYERAQDYKRALKGHYGGEVKAMADRLRRDQSTIYEYLRMAEIPSTVADCFDDINEFTLKKAKPLAKALVRDSTANALLQEATRIKADQASMATKGLAPLKAAEVFKRLKRAAEGEVEKLHPGIKYYGDQENPSLILRNVNKSGITVNIPHRTGLSKKDVQAFFSKLLDEHWER